jgi:hypothetical protein
VKIVFEPWIIEEIFGKISWSERTLLCCSQRPMINSSHRITIGYAVQIKDHSSIHNFRNRLAPIYHLPSTIQTQADSFLRQRQLRLIGTWQLSSFAIREKQT